MKPRLSDGALDVRYVFLGGIGLEAMAALLPHLDEVERIDANRFLLLEDKLAFAVGRVLIRRMLSEHAREPLGGWRFERSPTGKPAIAHSPLDPDLRFNLSHCTGLVAAAVSIGREVGVDVEFVDERVDYLELARDNFPAVELNMLEGLHGVRRRETFFALWTLKEAYTKARGRGLSISLSEFAFTLDPPTISFFSESTQASSDWFFWRDRPSPSHLLAIAAQRQPEEELTCSKRRLEIAELF